MIYLQADTSTDWFPSSGSLSSRSQKLIFACRKYFSHVWMNANKFQLITKKGGFLLMKTDLLDCRSVLSCHIRILLPGFGELLARGKCDIWSLSDSNWIRTHNTQFVSEHSTIQPKWLECSWLSVHVKCLWLYLRTSCCGFIYKLSACGFQSRYSHLQMLLLAKLIVFPVLETLVISIRETALFPLAETPFIVLFRKKIKFFHLDVTLIST